MSKFFGYYAENVDRTWYNSSNVKYSECVDNDGELKTLRVVFANGTQYQYDEVDVRHYLSFREAASQGKALNEIIKGGGYKYSKLDNVDVGELDEELSFRMGNGLHLAYDDGVLTMTDNKDNVLITKEVELTEDLFDIICSVVSATGRNVSHDFVSKEESDND